MNEVPEDLVRRTAALARIALSPDEERTLGAQFARVLAAFRVLQAAEIGPQDEESAAEDRPGAPLRRDEVQEPVAPEALLAGAPARVDGFYSVPKTIGKRP
jgi:aspartyl/glutamyl-tRNA(Asn/Gln) amidotransferase C subunit